MQFIEQFFGDAVKRRRARQIGIMAHLRHGPPLTLTSEQAKVKRRSEQTTSSTKKDKFSAIRRKWSKLDLDDNESIDGENQQTTFF